jgi:hypothetical protein
VNELHRPDCGLGRSPSVWCGMVVGQSKNQAAVAQLQPQRIERQLQYGEEW